MHNPLDSHWQAIKQIFQYLNNIIHHGLYLSKPSHLFLEGFSDVDSTSDSNNRKLTSGYCIILG